EFRKRGHEAVDRICKYYKELDNYNVLPNVEPGYLKKLLLEEAPEEPESFDAIQSDIETKIIPGACTELETIVLDWVGKLIGLDKSFLSEGHGGGVIQATACDATLVVLLAARQRVIDKYKAEGLNDDQLYKISNRLIAYGSTQVNFNTNVRFRALPTDEKFSLRGDTVERELEKDISQGLIPCFLNGTIGTTGSAAVDRISELADANVWLHIDAAYAGSAFVCPEYRHYLNGQAFSLVCFHVIPNEKSRETSNELTEKVYNRLNETQKIYLTHIKLNNQFVIRFAVGSPWTAEEHIDRALDLIVKTTKEVIGIKNENGI
ncbi:2996_t:CDS:2, partial [Racocetra fulgida]